MRGIDIMRELLGKDERNNSIELDKFIRTYIKNSAFRGVKNTAWCAASLYACERAAGKAGSDALNAQSGLKYGIMIYDKRKVQGSIDAAQEGDIAVFERGAPGSGFGHIAYINRVLKSSDGIKLEIIGGNQWSPESGNSDEVNIARYGVVRLLGIRRS